MGTRIRSARHWLTLGTLALLFALSCAVQSRPPTAVQRWWKARGPVVPHDSFPADCSLCHTGDGWRTIRSDFEFDHAKETGVALEGAHATAECLRCHNDRGPASVFAARGCSGCHEDPHRGQLGGDCSGCHEQTDWRPNEILAMHSRTRFPLVGAHSVTACWRCHPGAQAGNFTHADTSCEACHLSDLARATNPDHVAQGWVKDCQRCHVPIAWSGGAFNHSAWPLTGKHAIAACNQCHVGGVFAGTPTQCVDCHLNDYQTATQPDHVGLNLSTNCAQCHNTSDWHDANFNHTGVTNGCVNCHMPDYQNATQPNHAGAGFGTTCEQCHTSTNNWNQTNWAHTDFPLNGHHNLACTKCHDVPTNYTQFTCTQCHAHSQSEMNDQHQGVPGYTWQSSACYSCHPNGHAR